MVSCSSFTNSVDCALTYTNEYNIKLIVLSLLLIYSVVLFLISNKINKEKSYMHYWAHYLSKVMPSMYVIFSPLMFTLLLSHNINLEVFITILVGFYLVGTGLFIGMAVYSGTSKLFQIFGFDDWNEFKDRYKERQSMKKYG